jgi:hypothetical protein
MSLLAICQPLLPVGITASAGAGAANLLTENPREAFVAAAAGAATITIDLGAAYDIDTVFLGFTNAAATDTFTVSVGSGGGAQVAAGTFAHSHRRAPLRHASVVLPATVSARHVTIATSTAAALIAGVVAVGRAIRPFSGHEWGSGRPITDTSQVDRLQSGSFAINRGVASGGWQWTMPNLTDDERERLYALALDVGIGGTVLVIEDPDPGFGLNERVHWSLLARLEPFARQQPGESKWAMQIGDWA